MFSYNILAGSIDQSVVIRIVDSTDGTPETGVVYNTSGIDIQYRREGAATTAITEATLAALTTAHADGGFLHIGNGYYRLDLPDAAVAAGVTGCLVHGTVTGMVVIGCYINLNPIPVDVRSWLGTAAATPATAGYPAVTIKEGVGTGEINLASGRAQADVRFWNGNAVPTSDTSGYPKVTIKSGTGTGELSLASGRTAADLTYWSGSAVAAVDTAGYPKVTVKSGSGTGELSLTSGKVDIAASGITASSFAGGAVNAAALATDAANEIRDAIMGYVAESQGSYTVEHILKVVFAALAGVTGTGGTVIKTPNGVQTRITATVNGSNERTAMTITTT